MDRPKTLLLDLDNTLIDYQLDFVGCWRRATEETATALGFDDAGALLGALRREVRKSFGDPSENWLTRDLRVAIHESASRALQSVSLSDAHAGELVDRYDEVRDATTCLFPGALETIERFRAEGTCIGMVTNGNAGLQRSKIRRFALAPYFDSIHVEGEVGVGKPDPRIFQAALDANASTPEDTWMVGDNLDKDVAGAQYVGIHAVWCDSQREGLAPAADVAPDRIVHRVSELWGAE
ncbi:MAG: HAD-IA family hydrolase [Myxococcota bacterium]